MERLVGEGGDVDATDDYGETALIASCRHGHEEVAAVLIDGGAQVNKENKYKETLFHFASPNGRPLLWSLIMENGGDVTAEDIIGIYTFTVLA